MWEKNKKIDSDVTPLTRTNSKWTIVNVKCKTIKLLKYAIGKNLGDCGFSDDFLDIT